MTWTNVLFYRSIRIVNILLMHAVIAIPLKTQAQAKWNCGESEKPTVVATFDGATQTLVITGNGKMCEDCRPWINIRDGIKIVKVNSGVTTIPSQAFGSYYDNSRYNNLETVIIPNSVTQIGFGAFENATLLRKIDIPNSLTVIEYGAFKQSGLKGNVTLPQSIKYIGHSVFQSTSLKTVDLSKTQISILLGALFENCSQLEEVYLPKTIEDIEQNVFKGCDSLKSITCFNPTPPNIGLKVFHEEAYSDMSFGKRIRSDINALLRKMTLYVPEASVSVYKYSDVWKEFGKIEAIATSSNPNLKPTTSQKK